MNARFSRKAFLRMTGAAALSFAALASGIGATSMLNQARAAGQGQGQGQGLGQGKGKQGGMDERKLQKKQEAMQKRDRAMERAQNEYHERIRKAERDAKKEQNAERARQMREERIREAERRLSQDRARIEQQYQDQIRKIENGEE